MGQQNWDHLLDRALFCVWLLVVCLGVYEVREASHKPDSTHVSIELP